MADLCAVTELSEKHEWALRSVKQMFQDSAFVSVSLNSKSLFESDEDLAQVISLRVLHTYVHFSTNSVRFIA